VDTGHAASTVDLVEGSNVVTVGSFKPRPDTRFQIEGDGDKRKVLFEVQSRWSVRSSWITVTVYFLIGYMLWIGSFYYHATFTDQWSYGDFAGMLGIAAFTPAYALARLRILKLRGCKWTGGFMAPGLERYRGLIFFVLFAVLYTVGFLLRYYITPDPTLPIFVSYLFSGILLELIYLLVLFIICDPSVRLRLLWHFFWLFMAGVFMGVGYALQHFDAIYATWLCDPTSVYQGHANWHVFSAIGYLLLFFFYFSEGSVAYLPRV